MDLSFQVYYLAGKRFDKVDRVAVGNKVAKIKREGEYWNSLDFLQRYIKDEKEVTKVSSMLVESNEEFLAAVSEYHFGDLLEVEFTLEDVDSTPRFKRVIRLVKKSPFPPLANVGGFEKKKSAIEEFDALGGKI